MSYKKNTHALVTQAAFLSNRRNALLLLQLPDGCWQLPGGKLHSKEQWQEGLLREIQEETGITDVTIERVLFVDNWHTATHDYYRTYFACTTDTEDVVLSSDHVAYVWLERDAHLQSYVFTHATVREHIATFWGLK